MISHKQTNNIVVLTCAGLLGLGALSACGAGAAPADMGEARSAYTRAQSSPAAQFKPDQLHEAKVALDKAELAYVDSRTSQKTKDLAYIAERKAEIAEVQGRDAKAAQDKMQAEKDLDRATQSQLSQTQGQLSTTGRQLQGTEQALAGTQLQLAGERAAREQAEKRAHEAMEKLAATAAGNNIKEDTRGTIITIPGSVLFASGKTTLLPTAQTKLNAVADALKDQADHQIIVEGHTDSQGTIASNDELSQGRAQAVRDYLVSRGVPSDRIRAQGLGAGRPVADNKSPEGRANNRRVEIVVERVEAK
jgi:outer membrane protein OmpA-like peptidoglycan-associated protein